MTIPEGIKKRGLVYSVKDKESLKLLTAVEDGATIKIGKYWIKVKFSEGTKYYENAGLLSTVEDFATGKVQDVYVRPVFIGNFLFQVKEIKPNEADTGPVKGEQPGMLGVPGKVHVQKRPYSIGQQELEDYGKYRRQMLIDYDRKYSLEQLKEMCRAKGYSASGDKKTLIGRLI